MNQGLLSVSERRRIIEGFYAAYSKRDVDGMMQWLTDDIVEDLSGIGYVTGAVEERTFLNSLFSAFPDLETRLTQVCIDDNATSVEWYRRGTFSGKPFQGILATGRSFELRGGAFFEFSEGRIKRINGYYDSSDFAKHIGLLPRDGTVTDRLLKRLFNMVTRIRNLHVTL